MKQSLAGFVPWLVYLALSPLDWRVGAAAALLAAAAGLVRGRRRGDGDLLGRATTAYFGVLLPVAVLRPEAGLHRFTPALSLLVLGATAAASLLGEPFTVPIARRSVPAEFWAHPEFIRVNRVITAVWAASMLTAGVTIAAVLATEPHATWAWVTIEVVGLIVPARFTRMYPARIRARAGRAVRP